jgi:hypothetical protein
MQISPAVQRSRDADSLTLLQNELKNAKTPADQASLQREITRRQATAAPPSNTLSGALSLFDKPLSPTATDAPVKPEESAGVQSKKRISQYSDAMLKDMANGKPMATTTGLLEGAGNIVSGLGATAVGGLAGLARGAYNLATGESFQKSSDLAQQTIEDVQKAGTYQPRTNAGKLVAELASVPGAALHEMGSSVGGDIGQYVGGAQGKIAGQAIGGAVPDIGGAVLGGRAALKAAGPRIAPTEQPPAAATATGPQSAGAAAANFSSQAAAEGATPAVQAAIREAEAKGGVHPEAARRHIDASSLPVPVEITAGQATGDIHVLSHEKNMRGAHPEYADRFKEQNGQLAQNLDAIRDQAAPDVYHVDHVEAGDSLINSYKTLDAERSADISAKYKALEEANGGQFPVDGQAFVAAADAALAKKMKGRYVPPEIAADMDSFRHGATMTFEDFENMRTNLASEARKAERSGDGNRAMAASIVRDSLEQLPMTGESAALKPLADAARSAARERFDLIKADPAYKAAINDTTPADRFINKHVVNATVKDAKTMQANLAGDPAAAQTIAAGALNHLKNQAMRSGNNFSQAGFNKGLDALRPKLDIVIPGEAAGQLEKLGRVARYTQEQPVGSYVNNSGTYVAQAANAAKDLALGALDVKTLGASKVVRNMVSKRSEQKAVNKTLAPGAGVKISDLLKQ